MDQEFLRNLVLNVREPVVISGQEIPWKCFKQSLKEWLEELHELNENPEFYRAPRKHGNSPQFERFRTSVPAVNFGNFLSHAESEDHSLCFSYKSLAEVPGTQDIDMSFCGFPGISQEVTMWLGSAGSNTSCHYDTYGRNVVVQVKGHKRWILFSPETSDELRPTRIPYEESSVYSEMSFFSPREPKEYSELSKKAFVVDLNPGDILLLPPKWWHYVEALDNSLSFNAWIPIPQDRISRIDEYLVILQLSKMIPKDLSEAQMEWLLNPNSMESVNEDLPENTLNLLLKDVADLATDSPKKCRREYEECYLTECELDQLIQKHPGRVSKVVPIPETFMKFISENSLRFCPEIHSQLESRRCEDPLASLTLLINSLCHPRTVETARKHLLKSSGSFDHSCF